MPVGWRGWTPTRSPDEPAGPRRRRAPEGDIRVQSLQLVRSRMSLRSCGLQAFASLAEIAATLARISRPIGRQYPLAHVMMKRRVRPIHDARHKAMLHRIEMDVV